jgi:hypothetical protein
MAGENLIIDGMLKGSLRLQGEVVDKTTAGTATNPIEVYIRDRNGMIMYATGLEVPGDIAGYAKGCLFVDKNVADGTTGLYVNVGTEASADFDAVSDV